MLLSFLSGSCGLAYEVLYSRILSSYLGSMFYVSGSILFSFLFGLGLGSILEKKVGSKLKYLELLIGLYALFTAFLFEFNGMPVARFAANLASYHPLLLSTFCILFLLPPAVLIGVCVPAFSRRAVGFYKNTEASFRLVYAFYNLGAAAVILLIEFYLVRTVRLTTCLKILSLVNLSVFLALSLLKIKTSYSNLEEKFRLSRVEAVLFTLCFLSGVFQILFLKVSYNLWGPLNENFAIIISVSTLSIFLASALSSRFKISFQSLLYLTAFSVLLPFVFAKDMVSLYSHVIYYYGEAYDIEFLIKYVAIFSLSFLPMTAFGAALPVFKSSYSKTSVGNVMAVSSFGNAAGYLATTLFLHEHFHETTLLIFIALSLFILCFYLSKTFNLKRFVFLSLSSTLLILCFSYRWPYVDMSIGYRVLMNPANLKTHRSWTDARYREFKKYDSSVLITDFDDGGKILSHNGYRSLRFFNDNVTLQEMISGLVSVLFAENRKKALVLGLGSGVTAGAVAQMYKNTEVVEINPAILKVVDEFSEENLGVMKKTKVYIQDGIVRLLNSPKKYDVIFNTSTSPYYFSSNKLWSKEVLKVMADKLEPGGVYTSWIDTRVGKKGFTILNNTLKTVFKDCVYLYLSSAYFSYTCSKENLELKSQFEFSEELKKSFKNHLGEKYDIYSFLKNLLISETFTPIESSNKKINSLNFPALEYTFKAFPDNMVYFLRENLKKASRIDPFSKKKLDYKAYHQKCRAWAILGSDIWTHICVDEH